MKTSDISHSDCFNSKFVTVITMISHTQGQKCISDKGKVSKKHKSKYLIECVLHLFMAVIK